MKSWREFALILAVCALVVTWSLRPSNEVDDKEELGGITTPDYHPVDLTKDLGEPKRDIILVNLDPDPELLAWCTVEIEAATGARVAQVISANDIGLGDEAYDETRHQDNAEIIIEKMSDYFSDSEHAALAVTSRDLYTSAKPEWRYCFGTHGSNRTAVISSVRMGGRFQDTLFPSKRAKDRFRKLLLRYVLEMAYDTPRNSDPKSLLYNRVLAPRDLSKMEYRI
jgi:hypothetical protein